ncbi:MAG TPA: hypothetical protein VH008_07320 [Pseudonocardia sp.]|nr:hypothetical protein [Pseudonocardia sp.]
MDNTLVWFFICYVTFVFFPFMIPVVHAAIDVVKAATRGLRRELVEQHDGALRSAAGLASHI